MKDQNYWIEEYKKRGGFWKHSGNPSQPHALYTSGTHGDTYTNCTKFVEEPAFLKSAVTELLTRIESKLNPKPDIVIGSAMGAIVVAYEFASQLGCNFAYTEKTEDTKDKELLFKRFDITPGATVLVVEDMVNKGTTTQKTLDTLSKLEVTVLPVVPVFMTYQPENNRMIGDCGVVALASADANVYQPDDCPLCKAGSEALRPKQHWNELNS